MGGAEVTLAAADFLKNRRRRRRMLLPDKPLLQACKRGWSSPAAGSLQKHAPPSSFPVFKKSAPVSLLFVGCGRIISV